MIVTFFQILQAHGVGRRGKIVGKEFMIKQIYLWPIIKKEKWLKDIFNSQKSYDFWTKAFDRRYKNLDDDWDRPWTLANLINNRLNIFPNKNLISNIGDDTAALHSNPKNGII